MEFCLQIEPNFVLELTVSELKSISDHLGFGFLIDGNYIVSFLSLLLRQSRNAKNFGCLQERTQRSLMDVHLAVIDELDEGMQIGESDILQYDHGVLAWRALKDVKHVNSYSKCQRRQMSFRSKTIIVRLPKNGRTECEREKWPFVHVNCSKARVDCITCLTAKKVRKIKLYERHLAKLCMDNKFKLLSNLRCGKCPFQSRIMQIFK